tara:strand:- start:977 stop:1576 length:600 start_codon:yes stop_codon:yes gene_type:complete
MFQIYSDKIKEFECKIAVEGASLSNTKARIVLEGKKYNIIYEGSLDSEGWCTVKINPTKHLFENGETGKAMLEVIADDTYFIPWESQFNVKAEKKVTVEVIESDKTTALNKPSVKATISEKTLKNKPLKNKTLNKKTVTISAVSEKLYEHLVSNRVTQRAIRTRPEKVTKLVGGFMKKYTFNKKSGKEIITKALKKIQR